MVRSGAERGAVTAEAAVVLSLLAVTTVGLAWLVGLGIVQARAQDAAREAARVVARGESVAQGTALARRVATAGARVQVSTTEHDVVVRVRVPVGSPGGILGFLPDIELTGTAVAAREGR